MPMQSTCSKCYENLSVSVYVDYVDRSWGSLDVSTSCLDDISASIAGCHGNTSADVTNNKTENTFKYLLEHYGIMNVIESDY